MASNPRVILSVVLLAAACAPEYEIIPEPVDIDPGDVTDCEFTPVSGTRMSVYDCNPVFTSPGEGWGEHVDSVAFHTTMVLDHPFYQMWYSAANTGSPYGLGYAISGDGTDWTTNAANPLLTSTAGQWDQDGMDAINIIWDPTVGQYVMTYQGMTLPTGATDQGQWGLGVATSPDGVAWSKHPGNPVIDFVALGGSGYEPYVSPCWPLAITVGAYGFTGYLAGQYVDPWDLSGAMPSCDLYTASAATLDGWTMGNVPVMYADQWYDDAGIASAAIIEYDGLYYMFYIGFEAWDTSNPGYVMSLRHSLNLATSLDGITWIKDADNPLPVSLTAEGDVSAIGGQRVGKRIHLWLTDQYAEVDGEPYNGQAVGYFLFEPEIDLHP